MAETGLAVLPLPDYGFAFNDVNFSDRVMRVEILPDDDPFSLSTNAPQVQLRTIHISSPILAAKSPFFYKLFSNGMMESEQRHVTLRIQVSEEAALMDLLNFMYSNTLPRTTPTALLDVLMAADKFEVASCLTYCSQLLSSFPMTLESALFYLDLPSTVLVVDNLADTIQRLTNAARQFLVASFKDLSKHEEEVMKLPLVGIEAILSSDAAGGYRGCHLRYCAEMGPTNIALFLKAGVLPLANGSLHRFVERSYISPAVYVVEFYSPWQHCAVYLNLKREECKQLFPSGKIQSQPFFLGGQAFYLLAACKMGPNEFFGLFIAPGVRENGSVAFTAGCEVSVRMKPSEDFSRQSGLLQQDVLMGGNAGQVLVLLTAPWESVMADDTTFLISVPKRYVPL